ncbi:MAG: hypothetical protein OEZ01_06685 [Candidatus Heimdallarchaeota archaeon]|nr:hypothetical protein [Anaerolineae bacterium]MDH5645675.1 hypothetical protein [Candidatus Heimdallarchaeota archaeon]
MIRKISQSVQDFIRSIYAANKLSSFLWVLLIVFGLQVLTKTAFRSPEIPERAPVWYYVDWLEKHPGGCKILYAPLQVNIMSSEEYMVRWLGEMDYLMVGESKLYLEDENVVKYDYGGRPFIFEGKFSLSKTMLGYSSLEEGAQELSCVVEEDSEKFVEKYAVIDVIRK